MPLPPSLIRSIYVPKQVALTSGNYRIPKNPKIPANIAVSNYMLYKVYVEALKPELHMT